MCRILVMTVVGDLEICTTPPACWREEASNHNHHSSHPSPKIQNPEKNRALQQSGAGNTLGQDHVVAAGRPSAEEDEEDDEEIPVLTDSQR